MRISDWSSDVCSSDLHSALVAIDPVTQKQAWRVPLPAHFPGGIAATGGGLVFQGQVDSKFNAYDAKTGKLLWSFDAKALVIAPPITHTANGRQYVTVLTGLGPRGDRKRVVSGKSMQAR